MILQRAMNLLQKERGHASQSGRMTSAKNDVPPSSSGLAATG